MIPLSEIDSVTNKFQVPAETIEKDYVISWILLCLSKSDLKDNFIFYGGTAIKRIYFEDHRFSEDIDLFSTSYFTQDNLLRSLNALDYARKETNLALEIKKDSIIHTKDRTQLVIRYSGYDEIIGAPKEIRVDFSMNMRSYGTIEKNPIIASYSDIKIKNETLSVMTLNTIFANKLGLLIDLTRNEPRDFFDVWFLLQRLNKFDFNFSEVCEAFKDKYGFSPSLNLLKPHLQNRFLKTHWDMRLRKQIPISPNTEVIVKDIQIGLAKLFGKAQRLHRRKPR